MPFLGMVHDSFLFAHIESGVHLTDLVFIDEGQADKNGDLINFAKCKQISGVLRNLQLIQPSKYSIAPLPFFQVLKLAHRNRTQR